jgi:CAAX prenyl protease-like protein
VIPEPGRLPRFAAAVELSLLLALVYSFIWLWARRVPHPEIAIYVLGLGLTVTSHVIHRERPKELGLRFDNLVPSLAQAAAVVLPLVILILAIGAARGGWAWQPIDAGRFVRGYAWGFLQQYLLQSFIHRRVAALVERPLLRETAVGAIFASLHLPHPILVPATFLAGYVFATLFRRRPNILVLALCHVTGSTALAVAFGPQVLHQMRVGPGYFRY